MKSTDLKREIIKIPFNSSIVPKKQYYSGIEFTQVNQFVNFLLDNSVEDDLDYMGTFLPTALLDERGIFSIVYKDQDDQENWIGFHVNGEDVSYSYD
jgi:hypothetical protein